MPDSAAVGEYRGNWRRLFCWWYGHEYLLTTHLLHGTVEILCARCFARAAKAPTDE